MRRWFSSLVVGPGAIAARWDLAVLLALAWPLLAVLSPINHDESQYFAATALTGDALRPFVDFLYLQTPLQLYLTAPIAEFAEPYSFVALRLFTGLVGVATLGIAYRCQRAAGVRHHVALSAALLLAATYSFQFGTTVFRNDALPALLLGWSMLFALRGCEADPERERVLWALAGLLVTGAAAVKISYLFPAAAMGLFVLLRGLGQRRRWPAVLAWGIGTLPVLALIAWVRSQAPDRFDYGVLGYGMTEPFEWYRAIGQSYQLEVDEKLSDTLRILMSGPAWLALLLVGWTRFSGERGGRQRLDRGLLLDMLIVAGAVAALLPTPTYKQYAIPLLLPLLVRLGTCWRQLPGRERWTGLALRGALLAAVIPGAVVPTAALLEVASGKPNPVSLTLQAHWLGRQLERAHARGDIATLSPQVVLDSGYDIDPRFATGPFYYRSGDDESAAFQRRMNVVSARTLDTYLLERPPAAIVTGYETKADAFGVDLDRALRSFAQRHGYRLLLSPFGRAQLYIRPL